MNNNLNDAELLLEKFKTSVATYNLPPNNVVTPTCASSMILSSLAVEIILKVDHSKSSTINLILVNIKIEV